MPLCEGQSRPRGAESEMSCGIFMIVLGAGDNGTSLNSMRGGGGEARRGRRLHQRRALATAETEDLSPGRDLLRRAEEMKYFND